MDNKKWFKEAKFGMMIHWGLYSLLAGEYNGERTHGKYGAKYSEWIMNNLQIPIKEYEKLTKAFNPVFFDADEWCELAKKAGMKYLVITSKHHDGFCLFESTYDNYNTKNGTPFGRDVIKEVAEACKRHGLRLGIYYSQEIDWHEPNGGGFTWKDGSPKESYNYWDFPNHKKDFYKYFKEKTFHQVRELLTNYGDLLLIWFDTPGVISPKESQELYDLVKSIQPDCLVNTRIGNGLGDYRSMGDNEIPDDFFTDELVETPATINDTWGFMYYDDNWKSIDEIKRLKEHLNSRGVNYLLNVGPDHLGRIPVPSIEILKALDN